MDPSLSAWMDEVAPKRPPASLLEETFAQTMRADQVRVYPWHKVRVGPLGASRSFLPVAVLVLTALIVLAMVGAFAGGGSWVAVSPTLSPSPTPEPSQGASVGPSVALPTSIPVIAEATVAIQEPIALVASDGVLWALAPGRLDRIDPGANAVTGSVPLGLPTHQYNGLAANAEGLWATDSDAALLYRVDPVALALPASIPAGLAPKGVLATDAGVWVADVHDGKVLRIDPATSKVVATITVGPTGVSGPNWLASGFDSIWVGIPNDRSIVRIDPITNEIQASIPTENGVAPCGGFGIGMDAVWIASCSMAGVISRVDPTSNTVVATVDLGGFGYNPTMIDDAPWISVDTGDASSGMLVRIDPATNTIDRVLVPGATFGGGGDIVVAYGSVWVVDGYNAAIIRLPLAAFGP